MIRIIVLSILFVVFFGCKAGPPTGYEPLIESTLAVSCGLHPYKNVHKVFIETLYKCSDMSSSADCEGSYPSPIYGVNIVIMRDNDISYVALLSPAGFPHYEINIDSIRTGDVFNLNVYHPDYDSAWATITVPDSVSFDYISADSLDQNESTLSFEWSPAANAEGYDSHLFLILENDTNRYEIRMYDYVNIRDFTMRDDYPNKQTSLQYKIEDLTRQFSFLIAMGDVTEEQINSAEHIYLVLRVYSLDAAYYFSKLWENQPDEYSGFSTPLIHYSNIENGMGVFGSFWITESPKVFVSKDLVVSLFH